MSRNAKKLCYICLSKSKHLTDLHDYDADEVTYFTKLSKLLTSELIQHEPMAICPVCVKQLRISYKFVETVNLSQETLKKFINECNFGSEVNDRYNSASIIRRQVSVVADTAQEGIGLNDLLDRDYSDDANSEQNYSSEVKPLDSSELKTENHTCGTCLQCFRDSDQLAIHSCNEIKNSVSADNNCRDETVRSNQDSNKKGGVKISYQCAYCEVIFEKRWQLRKHISRLHEQNKKYICSFCNRGFKQSYHLKEHLTSHTGEKNYTCEFCDKKFQRSSSINRHMKSHEAPPGKKTKRTPFLCNICGKTFPFSNGVQRHMRVHLGIRKHECNICNRKFMQSTHLHVHMRTHTGERPFICDTCGESFSLKATLQKHITKLHVDVKIETYICVYCGEHFDYESILQEHVLSMHTETTVNNCQPTAPDLDDIKLFY